MSREIRLEGDSWVLRVGGVVVYESRSKKEVEDWLDFVENLELPSLLPITSK